MKTKLFFSIFSFLTVLSTFSQETTVNLSLGAGYTNQVYYKLSTQTQTDFVANSWDIAFLRTSSYSQAIVVNDAIGIEVFEASSNITEWDTIDVANETNWTQLYNSYIERSNGAFNQGSASYGWGEYNVTTHLVTGSVIFVLKYADASYKKFICEQYAAGYTIKYSSWDGTTWGENKTAVIANSNNPDNNYNYYSLQNEEEVVAEPAATDWDFVFRKYTTDYPYGETTIKYTVTGVLLSDNVEVAKATGDDTPNLTYATDINTIGYDWKTYTGSYVTNPDAKYYVKDKNGTIYKLYFTEFAGSSTGDVEFKFEDVTSTLNIEEVGESVAFGVYPNPVNSSKKINIIFDVNKVNQNENSVEIYNLSGQRVLKTNVTNTQGFYNKEIDLSALNSGVYMLKFISGDYQEFKKIVMQ
ncbi:MAG: T9SS type A sorting domain-containing protein [Polaribacter sp.]|uniref:T9SS type A sorting domain-containing protein n=1 Tax=Polaribacter sp. TaxID=1920175 RepID=UPI00326747D9